MINFVVCKKKYIKFYKTTSLIIFTQTRQLFRSAIACAALGVLGNTMTVIVLLATAHMRKHSTTPFLLSLALSDLIFCGFNLPLTAIRLHYRWQTSINVVKLTSLNISLRTNSCPLSGYNKNWNIYFSFIGKILAVVA